MPSFNTASVLIQQIHHIPLGRVLNCFNTASVLIQLGTVPRGMGKIRVSIQLLFLFNCVFARCVKIIFFVSIQLLFLFNKEVAKELKKEILFQYSFCSYSTDTVMALIRLGEEFQYSFCSYSTGNAPKISLPNVSFNTASVLIQPTCRVRFSEDTSVSIQLLFLFNKIIRDPVVVFAQFQYSFCSYSTMYGNMIYKKN